MAFRGTDPVCETIDIDGTVMEQVSNFKYLGLQCVLQYKQRLVNKLHKFNLVCGTIRRTLKSASKETRLIFYKVLVASVINLSLIHI